MVSIGLSDVLLSRDLCYAGHVRILVRDSSGKDLNVVSQGVKGRGLLKCIVDGKRLVLESYVFNNGKPVPLDIKYVDLSVPLDSWRHWAQRRRVLRSIEKLDRLAPR